MTSELARIHVDDLIRTAHDARRARTSVGRFPPRELDAARRTTKKASSGNATRWTAIAVLTTCAALLFAGDGSAAAQPAFTTDFDSIGETGTPFVRGVDCRAVDVDGYPREHIVHVP